MSLTPTDMLEIQTAIDEYERKFPGRPTPSAEEALAWRLGKREMARRQARVSPEGLNDRQFAEQECNWAAWTWQQLCTRWELWRAPGDGAAWLDGDVPAWVRKVAVVGWWGMFLVATACVFFFGAIVGGLK